VDDLTSTQGIVALVAAGIGLVALGLTIVLAIRLRRLRAAQTAVLGQNGERDLVSHATMLEAAFVQLRDWVEETGVRLEERMSTAEGRIDGCVAYSSLVRYDAYGEMSGRQSTSLALLDAERSGLVLSSIIHRDQARLYVKQLHRGESEIELSPEEREAIDQALAVRPRGGPEGVAPQGTAPAGA
jgi:hypothetical protein